jgi:hypothetical protein
MGQESVENIYNKTEESVFTLLALATQISQSYDSIFDNEDTINSDFSILENYSYHKLMNNTIYDALASQIILKSVAFIDEWNSYFGIKTESKDYEKIMQVKKLAEPAYTCLMEWKELYDYRNQAIAHNHRDKNKQNIYLTGKKFKNAPQTEDEILLLSFCIYKIAEIISKFFQEETVKVIRLIEQMIVDRSNEHTATSFSKDCRSKIKSVDEQITKALNNL